MNLPELPVWPPMAFESHAENTFWRRPSDQLGTVDEAHLARRLVDAAGVLMIALDTEGRVMMVNPKGSILLGAAQADLTGVDFIDAFVPAEDKSRIRALFEDIVAGRVSTEDPVESVIVRPDGGRRCIHWETTLITAPDGRTTGLLSCGTDITARIKAESELAESERRFRTIFEASPDAVFVERRDGTIVDANPAACKLHGMERADLIGRNVLELVPPETRENALDDLARLVNGDVRILQSHSWTVNDRAVPVEIRARSIRFDGADAVLLTVRDVSERHTAREEMRRFQERARTILDGIPDGILTLDNEGRISSTNRAATTIFGFSASELVEQPVHFLLSSTHFEDASDASIFTANAPESDTSAHEMTGRRSDGTLFPVEVTIRRVREISNESNIVIVHDISLRRTLERDVLRISEDERQRIGQDIHDHLASNFSGLALMGRGLLNQLRATPDYRVAPEMVEYIVEQARLGADKARVLAHGLNPVMLEERGLEAALGELTHQVETMTDISCHIAYASHTPPLEPSLASQLYRIAHEAVTNAMKHSGAGRIDIAVESSGDTLSLRVRDDGRGMPPGGSTADGMGIHIMKYRAGIIHGSVSIDSSPEEGTSVLCRVPV